MGLFSRSAAPTEPGQITLPPAPRDESERLPTSLIASPPEVFAPPPVAPPVPKEHQIELQKMKVRIHQQLVEKLDVQNLRSLPQDVVRREARNVIRELCQSEKSLLNCLEQEKLMDEVMDETFGLGPLETLLKDPAITDILINRFDRVYVERSGRIEPVDVQFRDNQHLRQIIDRIVAQVGRRVDEICPMVDARLSDGSRVNAIIPPLALDGPAMSIRRFGAKPLQVEDLIRHGAFPKVVIDFLAAAVQARCNILISGGTGSGKTTLLNCLSRYIQPDQRIITIEDAAELQLRQPHLARLETRPPNVEGLGAVRQRQLLINSLRMRPDRIIVGEVRGDEALDRLQAMNTGHDGSLTTVHANAPRDAISRLEVMVTLANANMHLTAIRQQIASAVHILVQCARFSDGSRRVSSITEITGIEVDVVTLQDIFVFEKRGVAPDGRVLGRFCATGILPKFNDKLLAAGIRLPLDMFDEVVEIGRS